MARTQQLAAGSMSLLALTIAMVLVPSVSGATHAAKRSKRSCPSHVAHRRSVYASHHAAHRRSAHASRERHPHAKVGICVRRRQRRGKTATPGVPVGHFAAPAVLASLPPPAPTNTVLPTVSGVAVEGQTLSASSGSWSGSPTSYAYQWEDCNAVGEGCLSVSGATASSYKLAASDVGHTVRVLVTASNAGGSTPASSAATAIVAGEQTNWRPVGAHPLSDAEAAAAVIHRPEQRPKNVVANEYAPSDVELSAFHTAESKTGWIYSAYVTGRPGLSKPSTDDLIQWGAHKWGIPEDWLRAEYVLESNWGQSQMGDRASVSSSWYGLYPTLAQITGASEVFQSMGITMVKWKPDNSVGAGTEPLRWKSTAFNIDYQAAEVRYYYDGYCGWCTSGYSSGQQWNSIGAWYEPYPWANASAQSYIASVQKILSEKPWLSTSF